MAIMLDVSVILPALSANNEYFRCLYSIRAAFSDRLKFEIICVVRDVNAFIGFEDLDLHIIREDESGIYGAMNNGIKKATGRYLYFIGQDDILLPAAANAIIQGKKNEADLILADVFCGKNRIFKNILSKKYLAWRNWCHQGIFYNRERFIKEIGEYPVHFKAQADHYVNIVFSSTPKTIKCRYNGCVAWYSSDGFSSKSPDLVFRQAFPKIVLEHIGIFSYALVVTRRLCLNVFKIYKQRFKST